MNNRLKLGSAIPSDRDGIITDAKRSSKAANSGFMLVGQFIGKGSLFVSMMFLARYLSDGDFGGLLFSIALGQIYLILSDLGVSLIINMRSSVRVADTQELLSTSFTIRTILCLLGFPLLMLTGYLLHLSSERMLVLGIIGISVVFESFAEMIYSIFRAREKMIYESICRISMGIIGLTTVLLLIQFRMDLTAIASAYVIRTLAAAIIAILCLKRIGFSILPSIDMLKIKELFISSIPVGIMGVVTVVHQRADNILIRQILGENAVAAWQECLKIIELMLLLVVPTLLPGALFPSLCRAFRDGGYKRQTGNMSRIFIGLAVVLSLSVLSAGDRFLRFIWGSEYLRNISSSEMQLCLYLCLGGLAAVYLWNILVSALLAVNKVRVVVPITTAALILVVGGNLLLMPVIGLPSAGIFFVAGNLLIVVCYWVFLKRRGYSLPIWREAAISILVSIPAFAAVILIRRMPFLPALILPVLIYIPFWWFTGGGRAIREVFPHKTV
ncbi:MAG: oligosaccharide flippase family protein [Candidatus Aegiribacteria sp.]|nr:oligosaccharide flippase family protein [Candidatus Aegiribacteria sp.]